MKPYQLAVIILFLTSSLSAQVPYGSYSLEDGKQLFVGEIEGKSFLVYNNGELRGLRQGAEVNTFEIGNALGQFERIEGQLQFSEKDKVIWKRKDVKTAGKKIPIREEAISFKNHRITLAGTLLLPEGNGPFPCIVFTHGSGAETRAGSRGLANLFVANGIAALIFDKRGTGKSSGKDWQDSFDNYASDALAAGEFIKKYPGIDSKKLGIYGHSQGGWIAPLAISKTTLFSFAIISAANAVSPVAQHLAAGDEEYRMTGMDETTIQEVHAFRLLKYEVGITGKNRREFNNKFLPEAKNKPWFKTTGGALPESSFWKANGFYDPAPALKAITCPILVLYADKDISTNTEMNLPLMKQLIRSNEVTYKVFQNANHMMMKVDKKGYATKQLPHVTQFADGYIETLINWTRQVTKML